MLLAASSSTALTLGRLRGVALIGQPLDLAVQVQLGEGDDAASPCFAAEVFHADIRQDPNRVRVVASPVKDQAVDVRILSSIVVDEPVVTIHFQAGCTRKTSRSYVLLADVPSESPSRSASLPQIAAAPAPVVQRLVEPAIAIKETATRAHTSKKSIKPKEPGAAKHKPTGAVAQNKSSRVTGQSHLKLDPMDLFSDRVAGLDSFMNFDLPADALLNAQRMQTLEATVKTSLALVSKNDASIADLKRRLEQAESERVPAEWMYGLLALALAGLAGVAYLLFRQRSVKVGTNDWMKGSDDAPASAFFDPVLRAAPKPLSTHGEIDFELPEDLVPEIAVSEFNPHHEPMAEMDVHLVEMSDSKFDSFMTTGAERLQRLQSEAPLSSETTVKPKALVLNLNAEATLDIRQQAEFFVSLGQTGRAIRILKKKMESGDDANPLIYLDLLGIYHSLKQKVDFQELREEFNSLFSGLVPEFSMFKNEGSDLEFYSEELNQISDLWPTPQVLALIETYVFHDPRNAQNRSFSLAAFRELLLLHAVAHILVSPSASDAAQSQDDAPDRPGHASFEFADMDFSESVLPLKESVVHHDLDLDLSDSTYDKPSMSLDTSLEFDFPLLLPEGQANPDTGNLMKFDLPTLPRKD